MHPIIIISGILLMLVCSGFLALFLRAFYEKTFLKALILKGIASICFVTLGALTLSQGEFSTTKILIFIGLCFGIVGDEVIALCQVFPKHDKLAFIGGGAFFLVGHVLYIVALFLLGTTNKLSLIASFLIISTISAAYAKRKGFLTREMKTPLTLYLIIVVFMTATAVGTFFGCFTLGAGIFAVGGMLFTASDNLLFAYKLGEKPKFVQNILLHAFYYSAQLLIAWSIALL